MVSGDDWILYRVFSWDGESDDNRPGGPLFVPRKWQGSGRHDNPERYGAFYASLDPISCVAEMLQPFRNQTITGVDLTRRQGRPALAEYRLSARASIVDLDDPRRLNHYELRPSRVATGQRSITQEWSDRLFLDDTDGFLWWSTLEAEWINCTLFAERVSETLRVESLPKPLSMTDPILISAARRLGIRFG